MARRRPRSNDTLSGDARETTRAADMSTFDELPAPIRAALNYHPLCMAAEDAADALQAGYSAEDVLRALGEAA